MIGREGAEGTCYKADKYVFNNKVRYRYIIHVKVTVEDLHGRDGECKREREKT